MAATNLIPAHATAAGDIHDIRPPVIIPGLERLWWVLGILAAIIILTIVIRKILKRRKNLPPPPPVPAHVRARQKLEEALALIAQPKPFCILVSDTIRQYLEERFEFRAPERTTEEFLYELRKSHLLTSDQKESLSGFLQGCDLVKFAKYEPGEPELRGLHESALCLISETEPLPAGAAAPVVAAKSEEPAPEPANP